MTHYLIEVVLWMLAIFILGCAIGYLAHRLFGSEEAASTAPPAHATVPSPATELVPAAEASAPVERTMPAAPVPAPAPPPAPAAAVAPEPPSMPAAPLAAVAVGRMERPRGLAEPRGGTPDKLQRISGIGPKNEKILHTLGFFHFDQIAAWTREQIVWVDDHLKFNGRIDREEWVEQARLLASGDLQAFEARYGSRRNR